MNVGILLGLGARGTATPFSPLSIPNLLVWYDIGQATESGGLATAVPDRSGNGNNATLTSAPNYTAANASYGSKPTIDFPAAGTRRIVTPVLGIDTSAYTIVAVADIGGASGYLCSADDANDAAQIYRVAGNVAFSSQFLPSTASISGAGAANPNVIVAIGNGASSKIFVSAKTAAATGNAGTHDLTGNAHTIGNYQNSVAGTFAMGGSLAQFLIYERALSDLEVGNILDYFGSLHGITIGA